MSLAPTATKNHEAKRNGDNQSLPTTEHDGEPQEEATLSGSCPPITSAVRSFSSAILAISIPESEGDDLDGEELSFCAMDESTSGLHGEDDSQLQEAFQPTSGGTKQKKKANDATNEEVEYFITPDQVRSTDILLGRDGSTYKHPGNNVFRSVIQQHRLAYHAPDCRRHDKTVLARNIVRILQTKHQARFLKKHKPCGAGEYTTRSPSRSPNNSRPPSPVNPGTTRAGMVSPMTVASETSMDTSFDDNGEIKQYVWREISLTEARGKIAHALRNAKPSKISKPEQSSSSSSPKTVTPKKASKKRPVKNSPSPLKVRGIQDIPKKTSKAQSKKMLKVKDLQDVPMVEATPKKGDSLSGNKKQGANLVPFPRIASSLFCREELEEDKELVAYSTKPVPKHLQKGRTVTPRRPSSCPPPPGLHQTQSYQRSVDEDCSFLDLAVEQHSLFRTMMVTHQHESSPFPAFEIPPLSTHPLREDSESYWNHPWLFSGESSSFEFNNHSAEV